MIRLSAREREIAECLMRGMDNAEIGKELKMAYRTVKGHMNRLFMRAQIRSGIKRVKLAVILFHQFKAEEDALNKAFNKQLSGETECSGIN